MEYTKGLRVDILQNPHGNFSNKGVSLRCKEATIVGPGVPQIHAVRDDAPAVVLVKRDLTGGEYVHAEPLATQGKWHMAGGTFLYTSDSRFREIVGHGQPISFHDRIEGYIHTDID